VMSERHEEASPPGEPNQVAPMVSGHDPVISKVDRYLKVSHQVLGSMLPGFARIRVEATEKAVMDSFSVPELRLGHPTRGTRVWLAPEQSPGVKVWRRWGLKPEAPLSE
jgi:hypothetical protein